MAPPVIKLFLLVACFYLVSTGVLALGLIGLFISLILGFLTVVEITNDL